MHCRVLNNILCLYTLYANMTTIPTYDSQKCFQTLPHGLGGVCVKLPSVEKHYFVKDTIISSLNFYRLTDVLASIWDFFKTILYLLLQWLKKTQ